LTVKLTTLSENSAGMGNYLAEWGLSILVETGSNKVLLDTGMSFSAVHNAKVLGIDLGAIDAIVLSHGHSDHTGGLREVLRRIKKEVKVVAHPAVFQAKYDKREGKPAKFIGIPFQIEELESLGARFFLTEEPSVIGPDIITTGEVPMVNHFESVDPMLFIKEGSEWKPDLAIDDQALIVKTGEGLIVILGCAHRGIINTLYHARNTTGVDQVYAVFGGSHLIGTTEERLWQTIGALKELGVQKLGLCHCTDLPAASVLVQEFGSNFIFNRSGTVIELPV
jgi:7,8-dihydropterin-6-yl-methyl-4-(beta-D-ribofuranosyl)aminobenzene 5'-phosphate synthase